MNCESCKYYKETHMDKGYCKLWEEFVKAFDSCEAWEDE